MGAKGASPQHFAVAHALQLNNCIALLAVIAVVDFCAYAFILTINKICNNSLFISQPFYGCVQAVAIFT